MQFHHAAEHPIPLHQLFWRAFFHHMAICQYHHMIGSHHCPHSVRDNQNCLILEQRGERSLEAGFVLYIQRGGRLVQQNNGGVFQQGAGNRNTLAFTPGQSRAIFAHHRQVSLRQTLNKLIALGGPGCGHNLLICGVLAAQTDMSHDGIVEQHTSWNTMA